MAIVYRTAGPWGGGSGADLAASIIDTNFYTHELDIAAINTAISGGAVVSIESMSVSGRLLTVTLTSGGTLGPYTLPVAAFNPRGAWRTLTSYAVQDLIVGTDGNLYLVIFNHVSGSSFRSECLPALTGMGHNYYSLLLPGVESTVPQVIDISADVLEPSLIEVNAYFRLHAAHTVVIIPENAAVGFPDQYRASLPHSTGWRPGDFRDCERLARSVEYSRRRTQQDGAHRSDGHRQESRDR